MSIQETITKNYLQPFFMEGSHQIFSSVIRVDEKAYLAKSDHPEVWLNPDHAYIRTLDDTPQTYIRTMPQRNTSHLHRALTGIYDMIYRTIPENERIWPFTTYRRGQHVYLTPTEYRFSFDKNFIKQMKKESDTPNFEDKIYQKLAGNFTYYEWMITYLFGATPIVYSSFLEETLHESGYDTQLLFVRSATQMPDMRVVISQHHKLQMAAEPHTFSVFLDHQSDEFATVSADTLKFLHYFLLLMVWMDDTHESRDAHMMGEQRKRETAISHPDTPSSYKLEGVALLEQMVQMLEELQAPEEDIAMIQGFSKQFNQPLDTMASKTLHLITKEEDYISAAFNIADTHREEAYKYPYYLKGFETMELSTQIFMFDCLRFGVAVDIYDEDEQFIRLQYKDHVEYVKNGNVSSHVSYAASQAMENKTVTKEILRDAGYVVPDGKQFSSPDEAKAAYRFVEKRPFVVKPTSANAGKGITVFSEGATQKAYEEAIDAASEYGQTILVEDYHGGEEFRVHVVNRKPAAVLARIPANVIGDGEHTIEELVEIKNQDPIRGEDHRTPLERIKLGKIELDVLEEDGYQVTDIPEKDEQVFFRRNSNVSTGGDSVDFTDELHESYRRIGSEIAEALEAKVCGVDLIITDPSKPSTEEEPGYVCIEANANPAMYAHIYVAHGKERRLTLNTLDMLFPELKVFEKELPDDKLAN